MQNEHNIPAEQDIATDQSNTPTQENLKPKNNTGKKRKFKTKKQQPSKKTTPQPKKNNIPDLIIDDTISYKALIKTSEGDMLFKLYLNESPITVNNFIFLATQGFYKDNQFHRIIFDFIIEGGCPKGDGTGSVGYKFKYEVNNLEYYYGSLVMTSADNDHKGGRYTNGCQFFIVNGKQVNIFKKNTIFGMLTEGEDVLAKISETDTLENKGELSKPITKIKITDIEIIEEQESKSDEFEIYPID